MSPAEGASHHETGCIARAADSNASSSAESSAETSAETSAESSAESSAEDSSSSEESDSLGARPVFLKKKQAPARPQARAVPALARAEQFQKGPARAPDSPLDEADAVDDTDDVEPEAEFERWRARERHRRTRDAQVLAEAEQAKEELLRRKQARGSG